MDNTELFSWFYSEYGESYSHDELIFIPRFILEKLDTAKKDKDEAGFTEILTVVTEPNQVILHKIAALRGAPPAQAKPSKPATPGSYIHPPGGRGAGDKISDFKTGFNIEMNPGGIDIQE